MGINPDDGAVSAAAALAADSGAAVPSAVSDDMEARSVADDVPSGRSADADRGGVPSAYGNVRPGGAPRGAASVAPGGSAAAASGGIARVSPLPAGQYFDGLDTRGRKALAKEAALILRALRISGKSPRLCAEKSSRRITRGLRRIIRRLPKPNRVTCRRPCVWRMPCLFLKKGFPSLPMRWIRNRAGGLTRCLNGCAVMRRRWRTIRRTGLCAGRRVWRICADIILRVWRNRRGCTRLPCATSGIGGCVGQA